MKLRNTEDEWGEVPVNEEVKKRLMNLTKEKLVEKIVNISLEFYLAKEKMEDMKTRLHKTEAYVEQGKSMIEAVMKKWDEYDV